MLFPGKEQHNAIYSNAAHEKYFFLPVIYNILTTRLPGTLSPYIAALIDGTTL